jgi:hypothetical protein
MNIFPHFYISPGGFSHPPHIDIILVFVLLFFIKEFTFNLTFCLFRKKLSELRRYLFNQLSQSVIEDLAAAVVHFVATNELQVQCFLFFKFFISVTCRNDKKKSERENVKRGEEEKF